MLRGCGCDPRRPRTSWEKRINRLEPQPKCAWSLDEADQRLADLLKITLEHESLVAKRDTEIAAIQRKFANQIAVAHRLIQSLTADIESWYRLQGREYAAEGAKSLQLSHGSLSMRTPSQPALIPLNEKWTWEKIARKLKRLWKLKYLHPPKPPAVDKVKIKRELDAEQLAACGLKLDTAESFHLELNRLAQEKAA